MKLKDNVYQAQSFFTVPRYILVPNLEILTSIIGDLSRGQAWSKWVKMWQRISISPGISKLFKPQNNMILNLCVLHLWSKFSDIRLNGWGIMAQTITGLTHRDGQTQAMTIPEGKHYMSKRPSWYSLHMNSGDFAPDHSSTFPMEKSPGLESLLNCSSLFDTTDMSGLPGAYLNIFWPFM